MFNENGNDLFENVDMGQFESSGAVGASPDGLGSASSLSTMTPEQMANPSVGPNHDFNIPQGGNAFYPGTNPPYPYGATAGTLDFLEPEDTSSASASKSAGFTLLFVAVASGVGYAAKGAMGAATGLLLSGAVANGYRAQKWWNSHEPSEKHEAIVSGIFAAGGLITAGYLAYRAAQEK